MSGLRRWFSPELWLVVGIPLATVAGGLLTLVLVRGGVDLRFEVRDLDSGLVVAEEARFFAPVSR